jgi:hypothetical protein
MSTKVIKTVEEAEKKAPAPQATAKQPLYRPPTLEWRTGALGPNWAPPIDTWTVGGEPIAAHCRHLIGYGETDQGKADPLVKEYLDSLPVGRFASQQVRERADDMRAADCKPGADSEIGKALGLYQDMTKRMQQDPGFRAAMAVNGVNLPDDDFRPDPASLDVYEQKKAWVKKHYPDMVAGMAGKFFHSAVVDARGGPGVGDEGYIPVVIGGKEVRVGDQVLHIKPLDEAKAQEQGHRAHERASMKDLEALNQSIVDVDEVSAGGGASSQWFKPISGV